ncbi:NADH-quinone oxidoreductase subunit A [Buchnera aphidicola (Eriosoma lanigerum)]|uniref:NADH-quinone oxidoreductase subunit A n=1 Tax=Buchnera aphidicola TaxID=9 RepID=UPI003464630C
MYINSMYSYLPFFIFFISIFIICFLMLLCGLVLGDRSYSRYKNTVFESGIVPFGDTNIRFSIKFYLVAIFFVIFDTESVFLYIWVSTINETQWIGLFEIFIFIFELLVGLIYLISLGGLDWKNVMKKKLLKI